MGKDGTDFRDEFDELQRRLDWLEEERRKANRRLAEAEQHLTYQDREMASREQRIQELEEKLAKATAQVAKLSQVDNQMQVFRDEIVKLVEQYDQRRIRGDDELDKLRRVEHEAQQRELSEIRKEIVAIGQIENSLELRQAEESRLARLISSLGNRVTTVENDAERWNQERAFLEEAERSNARAIGELETKLLEGNKKLEPLEVRLEVSSHKLAKLEVKVQEATDGMTQLSESIQQWSEQVQVGEYERNKALEGWQRTLEERQEQIDRFAEEWVKYAETYKDAKMTVQAIEEWQRQQEQQQRETTELARVEASRMRTRWDNFLVENEKQWKNFEVDQDQRWSGAQRRDKQILEQVAELSDLVDKIQEDKDTLWRVQNAQADAIKKMPRIWLEEVEKAIAHNPNSRRQPTLVPVREE